MEAEAILRRIDELSARHDRDEDATSMRIAAIEQRMARVETRGDGWERQIRDILNKMEVMQAEMRDKLDAMQRDVKCGIREVYDLVTEHINEDVKLQRTILISMLVAAAGGLASVGGWFISTVLGHIVP